MKYSGHCSVGACRRCLGYVENGSHARNPYWFCRHSCHLPVAVRRARLAERLGYDPFTRRAAELKQEAEQDGAEA